MPQADTLEIRPIEVRSGEARPDKVRLEEVRLNDAHPDGVCYREVQLGEIRLTEGRPGEVRQVKNRPLRNSTNLKPVRPSSQAKDLTSGSQFDYPSNR